MCKPGLRTLVSYEAVVHVVSVTRATSKPTFFLICFLCTYSYRGAIFANATIHDDVKVVVAGVECASDDTNDREDVQLQSEERQLRKHTGHII